MLHFRLDFLPDNAKTRTSNFRKVVRQHTEGMVGSITGYINFVEHLLIFPAVKEF